MTTTIRTMMILALAVAGCSGGGESTTAMTTMATGDTGMSTTDEPTTNAPTTSEPTTDEPTTSEPTGDTTMGGSTTDEPTTTGGCPDVGLVGTWLSEGDNVAPLLQGFGLVSIEATFEESVFTVESLDGMGAMGTQSGTYAVELCPGSQTKYSIILEQTMPQAITAEGIFEIDGCMEPAMMRYEVIQTQPDLGAQAPTCDDDFGAGEFGTDNIQIFIRQ
ncbi:MAG: hypothetical protein KDK70_04405 [Myxococcales bacterium]|nr:hypothetical protein [Myxococcales bacterium]